MEYIKKFKEEMEDIRQQLIPWFGDDIRIEDANIIVGNYPIVSFNGTCVDNNFCYAYEDYDFNIEDVFVEVGYNLTEIKVKPKPQPKHFTKDVLSNGDIVLMRDGHVRIFIKDAKLQNKKDNLFIDLVNGQFLRMNDYNENLLFKKNEVFDVIKVCSCPYTGDNFRRLRSYNIEWTWEREDK